MNVYTANPNLVSTSYIRGLGLIAAKENNELTFYHYNAHGDVVQLTDANGNIIRDYTYDAFGVEQNADETDANPFRYCGEQFDAETGNYYLRARYYTPGTGRFGQEDTHWNPGNMVYGDEPLGLHTYTYKPDVAAVAQAGNLYAYGLNNPVLYRDADGRIAVVLPAAAATGAAISEEAILAIETLIAATTLAELMPSGQMTLSRVPELSDVGGQMAAGAISGIGAQISQAKGKVEASSKQGSVGTGSGTTASGGPDNDGRKRDYRKLSEYQIKKNKLDAHQIKRDVLTRREKISRFELYYDPQTGEVFVGAHGTSSSFIETGIFINP